MNNELAISIRQISKSYPIYHNNTDNTLRDFLVSSFKNLNSIFKKNNSNFWALKNINLDIKNGEKIGIIGKNGSGKSTLLKIISKIVTPDYGEIIIRGRVASLLEVGTGFHSELTGRENIYMSGSVLGMTRKEIDKKFKEIVDFSGIEEFLDIPVKKYSSGMQVKLGFAVAAHLDSEVLLVDEVLAVGDSEFQKKCLGKIKEINESGRTIFFVSHDMATIEKICDKCILLDKGKIVLFDKTEKVISKYLEKSASTNDIKKQISDLPYDDLLEIKEISLHQNKKKITGDYVKNGDLLEIKIKFFIKKEVKDLRIYFDLNDQNEIIVLRTFFDETKKMKSIKKGNYLSTACISENILAPINYTLRIKATIFNQRSCFKGKDINIPIKVFNTGIYNKNYPLDPCRAKIAPKIIWETKKI